MRFAKSPCLALGMIFTILVGISFISKFSTRHFTEESAYLAPTNDSLRHAEELDFFIAGFPKCGTTTLLHAFRNHPETAIGDVEYCSLCCYNGGQEDESIIADLMSHLDGLTTSVSIKRGIKCPTGIKDALGVSRVVKYLPDTKIIIGMRHPVLFFQSYYNYRITEMHNKNQLESVPPAETLIGRKWKGVTTELARFELSLKQLMKTNLTDSEQEPTAVVGIQKSSKVFLYSIEQLDDENEWRAKSFRKNLQTFLGLKRPFGPFTRENVNGHRTSLKYPEHINICDSEHNVLRSYFLFRARETQRWLREEFIASGDVVLGDREHFLALIDTWTRDPCTKS